MSFWRGPGATSKEADCMFELALILLIYAIFILYWLRRQAAHERRLRQ